MNTITRQNRFTSGRYINISVGDQRFSLNEAQIFSEPDSVFVNLFRGLEESELDADANVFRSIHAHLKGYEIFPLPPQGIPYGGGSFVKGDSRPVPYLSKEATLKNLLRDATDFGMKNLVAKVEREMDNARRREKQALDDDSEAMKGFVMLD
jgi:hypothetical protein